MHMTSKYTRFIILCTIFTFLSAAALGVLFAFIQVIMLGVLLLTFWFNPLSIIAQYFFVKKRIDNYSKREISGMEWALVKLDIILAQLAGVAMAYPLVLCIHKDFFVIWLGAFGILSVRIGMGVPLVIMLLVIGVKELYPTMKSKKEMGGLIRTLLILIVLMLFLTLAGFLLGKKLERYPSVEELFQNKSEYILKHMDHIETIREYIENLDYEEIVACGKWKQKVGNLDVSYHLENDGYSTLSLNAKEVLKNIGLKDINIVAYGDINIEFDTKTYKIGKIRIPVYYEQTGRRNLIGGSLIWYNSDYADRESGFILDDNWLIQWLKIGGHPDITPVTKAFEKC